jgi:hypothetical protein
MELLAKIHTDIVKRLDRIDLVRIVRNAVQITDDLKNKKSKAYKSPVKGGRWDKPYNKEYAKRQGKGLNNVNLRSNIQYVNGKKVKRKSRSIEETKVTTKQVDNGVRGRIEFRDKEKAKIFGLHQTGKAKGRKVRKIYPTKREEVPDVVTELIQDTITAEILRNG